VVLAATAIRAEKKGARALKAQPHAAQKSVAFLFTGQGSQYANMGKELYRSEPVFRAAVDQCAELLDNELPKPLLEVMHSDGDDGLLNQTQYSQPAIFTIEYALAELWRSRGLEPCAVLGHSVGEYAAAVVAGVLTLKDAVHLIAQRGRLIAEKCEAEVGTMAALFAPEQEVKKAMEKAKVKASDISVAAVNGPKMTVISGRKEVVDKVAETSGVTSRPLTVSHAFHSPLMQPMLKDFRSEVDKVSMSALKVPFFSTLLGREATSEDLAKVDYWVDHVSNAVRFTAGMEALENARSPEVFLEIGATPTLVGMAKRFLARKDVKWVASLDPKATQC